MEELTLSQDSNSEYPSDANEEEFDEEQEFREDIIRRVRETVRIVFDDVSETAIHSIAEVIMNDSDLLQHFNVVCITYRTSVRSLQNFYVRLLRKYLSQIQFDQP